MSGGEEGEVHEIAGDVLTWWFGTQFWSKGEPKNPTAHYDDLWRQRWFAKEELTAVVDNYIKANFQEHVDKAIAGDYDHWGKDHYGALAFVVLAASLSSRGTLTGLTIHAHQDQFTRNIYRGTAKAWAGDAKSLAICLQAIESGLDKKLKPVGRAMLYMPLLHAEDSALQTKSVELFAALFEEARSKSTGTLAILQRFHGISLRHKQSVELFGRFPERNRYLGRQSTPAEDAYLAG